MAVLDWISPESAFVVDGEQVRLRPPRGSDYAEWADDLSRASFRRRLSIYGRDMDLGQGYAFFVLRRSDDRLVGGINLRDVRRGVAQNGAMGYWVGAPFARQGFTLDAVRTVAGFAFQRLGLHRLEAACLPQNEASQRLLLKAGFEEEGRARAYLKINGQWCDHLLFGLIND